MLQRCSIARSFACDSKLLMLDEYSSGLDYFTKFELQDLLLKIFNNRDVDRTLLMVTHDISEAVYLSNRIYILDNLLMEKKFLPYNFFTFFFINSTILIMLKTIILLHKC